MGVRRPPTSQGGGGGGSGGRQICALAAQNVNEFQDSIPQTVRNSSRWNDLEDLYFLAAHARATMHTADTLNGPNLPALAALSGGFISFGASKTPSLAPLIRGAGALAAPVLVPLAGWLATMNKEEEVQKDRMIAYQWRIVQVEECGAASSTGT